MSTTLTGTVGNDTLIGTIGDDIFHGQGGNDSLVGGDGLDTAVFAGNRADYDLTQPNLVVNLATGETTTLSGIDQLLFDDGMTVLNTAPAAPADADAAADLVAENAAAGTVVGVTALAVDPEGAAVTYSLVDDAGGRFTIDAATGVVTVADGSLLDYEAATSHTIVVAASDGSQTSTAAMTIAVGNVNEAPSLPVDADATADTVTENASTGTVVGIAALSADPDAADSLTYSLTDDAGGRFAIDAASGVVTVADGSLLDHEAATGHTITVQVTDAGGLTSQQSFTIGVSNVNETPNAPADADAATNMVTENAATGTLVGITASASDPDAGDSITYSLTVDAGGRFAIDAATGVVTVADGSLLDHEAATGHTITVQATDAGGLSSQQSFTIGVTDVNEAPGTPTDATPAANLVAEGAAAGTVVGVTALAGDPEGAAVTYSLTDDAGGRFAIDAASGVVTVADGGLLDYEAATSHTITVQATDAGGLTSQRSFTIALTNVVEVHNYTGTAGDDVAGNAYATLDRWVMDGQSGNDGLTGGDLSDTLMGGAGNDTLDGGGGGDSLAGGTGDDTYRVDAGDDVVTEAAGEGTDTVRTTLAAYTLGATLENLIYEGGGSFTGTGNAANNAITGGAGNDTLNGGTGADTLNGGDGFDVVGYTAAVTVNLATGVHSGDAVGDQLVSIEGIAGSIYADSLTGNTSANWLTGGAGQDTLVGGAGNDTLDGGTGSDYMVGGAGDDLYIVDSTSDTPTEYSGSGDGIDTVQTTLNSYTLNAHLEHLIFTGTGNFHGIGGDRYNRIVGGAGNDTLSGGTGGGADTLIGGAGQRVARRWLGSGFALGLPLIRQRGRTPGVRGRACG